MWSKLSLRYKIGTGFLVIILIFVANFTFSTILNQKHCNEMDTLKNETIAHTLTFLDLKYNIVQIQQWLTDISATRAAEGYDDGYDEAENYYTLSKKQIATLIDAHQDEAEMLDTLHKLDEALDAYYSMGKKMAAVYIAEGPEAGNKIMEEFDPFAARLTELIDGVVVSHKDELGDRTNYILSSMRSDVFISIVLMFCIVVTAIALTLFLSSIILRPLLAMRDRLFELSQKGGDLTYRLSSRSKDELGELTDNINTFLEITHDMVLSIKSGMNDLAAGVAEIASGNENLSQRTSEQATSLEEIASTIEEASSTISQNADNSNSAKDATSELAEITDEGSMVVHKTVEAISELAASSSKIAEIITVINDIAFQTNLLALNAAVEAARAGDQGRGFAVVASEVRNLAQRAGSSAKEIGDLVKDSLSKIDKGTELSQKSGESLQNTLLTLQKVSAVIAEINASSLEQRQGMQQINLAISELDSMTQQNASLVEEIASSSSEMSRRAHELQDLVSVFKTSELA